MKIKLKAALCAFTVICILTAALCACSQAGTPYGTRNMQGTQNVGYNRTNSTGNTALNRTNMYGTTNLMNGTNMYGTTRTNMFGTTNTNMYGTTTPMNQTNMLGMGTGTNSGYNTTTQTQMLPNQQKAAQIKTQLDKMTGVKDAHVIVMGNTALVGCKTTGNLNAVRDRITRTVKQADNTITSVTVSNSPDVMNRMSRLSSDITSNRPINTIMNEFNKLVRGS